MQAHIVHHQTCELFHILATGRHLLFRFLLLLLLILSLIPVRVQALIVAISQVCIHLGEDDVYHLRERCFRGVSIDSRVCKKVDAVLGVYGIA